MIDQNIFSPERNFHGAKGIVFIADKMLLYRRDEKTDRCPKQVDLPGGGREGAESPFATFKREVQEEFGLIIENDNIVYAKSYVSTNDPTKESYFLVAKSAKLREEDIVFGNEGLEYFLLKPEDYLELRDAIPRQQEKVKEYLTHV